MEIYFNPDNHELAVIRPKRPVKQINGTGQLTIWDSLHGFAGLA